MRNATLYHYQIPTHSGIVLVKTTLNVREGLIVCLEEQGKIGWGEIAPLPTFSQESLDTAKQQTQTWLNTWLNTQEIPLESLAPSVAFGLSMALCELRGELADTGNFSSVPLYTGDMHRFQTQISHSNIAKMKIGREEPAKEGKIAAHLLTTFPDLRLRLDANRAWSLSQAVEFAEQITNTARHRIQFIEEPCHNPVLSKQFAEQCQIAIAWDETLREENILMTASPYVRAIVLKPMLTGSMQKCLELIQQAHYQGLQCVISSSLESSLGLTQLARLAHQYTPNTLAGLDTLHLMQYQLLRRWADSPIPLIGLESDYIQEITLD